ncbi:MAG: ATP-binding protein [Proteobacteria bacterium]|nr:ATP-binding protein [Pseudomonadota bacterium]
MPDETNEFPLPVTAFESPHEVLHYYGALFVALCLRYIHRHVESIVNDAGGYSPKSVALAELIHTLSGESSKQGLDWLKNRNLPPLERCEQMVQLFCEHIRLRTEKTYETKSNAQSILYIDAIKDRFILNELETYILISAALIQFDERYTHAWQYVTGASANEMPSAGFFLKLLDFSAHNLEDIYQCLQPQSPLLRYGLVTLKPLPGWDAQTPDIYARLTVPKSILAYFLGDTSAYVPSACKLIYKNKCEYTPHSAVEKAIYQHLKADNCRMCILGYSGMGREKAVIQIAQSLGYDTLCLSLKALHKEILQNQKSIQELFADIIREALIRNAVLWVDAQDLPSDTREWLELHADRIRHYFESEDLLKIAVRLQRQTTLSRQLFGELSEIIYPQPGRDEQPALWFECLKSILPKKQAKQTAEIMAQGYCLSAREIQDTIENTLTRFSLANSSTVLTPENLTDTLNKTRGQRLEGLATLRSTSLFLKDIVLSNETRKILDEILNYARYSDMVMQQWGFAKYNVSGAGLSVLLSGVPGTGKTLTALVLAHELGRALYVVDLSRIVDKYIGETEKKLSQIFDEAEYSQAMLLFDEADSLFAKRTDVKSSNDRYANLEVNYLLQRLEAYRGVSILTTNFGGGLDEALARRIQFKIEFPMPDAMQRAELWERLIPKDAPRADDIDLHAIAQHFEMSGGHIKNAIFRASISAASTHGPITHDMLWDAAVHEYRSMGHIIRDDSQEDESWHEIPYSSRYKP